MSETKTIKPGPHYQKRIRRALADPNVGAVVIVASSPGGPLPIAGAVTVARTDLRRALGVDRLGKHWTDRDVLMGDERFRHLVFPPAVRVDI